MALPILILLGLVAAGFLGLIAYFFLSPKSSKALKMAALIGLVLSGLTLAVCGAFVVLTGPPPPNEDYLPSPVAAAPPDSGGGNNTVELLVMLVVLVILLGIVLFLGFRDKKLRESVSTKKPAAPSGDSAQSGSFAESDLAETGDTGLEIGSETPETSDDDFNIDL